MDFNSSLAFLKYAVVEAVMSGNDEDLLDLIHKIIIQSGVNG